MYRLVPLEKKLRYGTEGVDRIAQSKQVLLVNICTLNLKTEQCSPHVSDILHWEICITVHDGAELLDRSKHTIDFRHITAESHLSNFICTHCR